MIAVITSVVIPSTQYTEYCICYENSLSNTHQRGMENKYHRFYLGFADQLWFNLMAKILILSVVRCFVRVK